LIEGDYTQIYSLNYILLFDCKLNNASFDLDRLRFRYAQSERLRGITWSKHTTLQRCAKI